VDDQVKIVLQLASGDIGRGEFTEWLRNHVVEKQNG
jgi:hypothetical protein